MQKQNETMRDAVLAVAQNLRSHDTIDASPRQRYLIDKIVRELMSQPPEAYEPKYQLSDFPDQRKFLGVWGADYQGVNEKTGAKMETHPLSFFCDQLGYTFDMRVEIDKLELGECLSLTEDHSGVHSIVRIA